MNKQLLSSLVLIILLSSCFKEVTIVLPPHVPSLAINSYFTVNKPIGVIVTQTQSNYDSLYHVKSQANVYISYGNTTSKLKHIKDSLYQTSFDAEYNVAYTLQVDAEGYQSISATDSIPEPVDFTIDKYIPTLGVDYEGENISGFTITMKDIPTTKCYFELRLRAYKSYVDWDESLNESDYYEYIDSKDIIVKNEGAVNQTFEKVGLLFTNDLIDTKDRSITFQFYHWLNDDYNSIEKATIELRTISHQYYLYKKKLYLNIENQEGDLWDGTGNPTDAYSNINNGYGIFSGYSQKAHIKNL